MITGQSVFRKDANVVVHKIVDEYLFVPIEENALTFESVYTTNEVGSRVWQLIDGVTDVSAIVRTITDEYQIEQETASSDVIGFMEVLHSKGCIDAVTGRP